MDATLASKARVLVERDGVLQDQKVSRCYPNPCETLAALTSEMRDPLAPPADLTDPVLVLSALRESLWVFGGTLRGAPYLGVHRYDVTEGQWYRVGTYTVGGDGLGQVLAATYAPATQLLYLLNQVEETPDDARSGRYGGRTVGTTRVRLLAMDPSLGEPITLASWRRRTRHDTFGLASDGAGRLYVVASREHGDAHVVVRLAPDEEGEWRAEAFAVGQGRYVTAGVHANRRGVSLAVRVPGGVRVVGYEAGELEPRRRCEEQCF